MEQQNVNPVAEEVIGLEADEFDIFDDLDDNHIEQVEETEELTETETETEPAAPDTEETASVEQTEQATPKPEQPEPQAQTYELNILGQKKSVTLDEMRALAQMGGDRDRIIQQRDALAQFKRENESILTELQDAAKAANMEAPAFLDALRENLLVQNGLSRDAAKERIRAERAERELNKGKAQQQRAEQEQMQRQQRMNADFQNFARLHPDVDPKSIPASVWKDFDNGISLVDAYSRFENQQVQAENKQLKERIAALEQNNLNKTKTAGSMRSVGNASTIDDFISGFDAE